MRRRMQINAPAGDLPCLRAAVDAGADSVYIGFQSPTNLRNLLHVAHVRLCSRAQWEIRRMMQACRRTMEPGFPLIARYMVVKCHPFAMGYCDEEFRTCGFRPLREKVVPADEACPPGPGYGEGD